MSIITVDADAKMVIPLAPLVELQVPELTAPQSGPTQLGLALEMIGGRIRQEIRKSSGEQKGEWANYVFVMTDEKPSDLQVFEERCPKIREIGFAGVIGCVAGPRDRKDDLVPLGEHVIAPDTMDSVGFTSLFKWVTAATSSENRSKKDRTAPNLPPPEIHIV